MNEKPKKFDMAVENNYFLDKNIGIGNTKITSAQIKEEKEAENGIFLGVYEKRYEL